MQMNRFARKLNNKSGNSIMMALLLLLVATVVSIVIVTVALTSTMHVDDNRTSQQEYLACVSAAEMLRDGLAGSTYTYEEKSGEYPYLNKEYVDEEYTNIWGETKTRSVLKEVTKKETYNPEPTSKTTATNDNLKNFVTKVSEAIRDGSSWITTSGTFKVSQTDIDANNPVEAYWKITQSSDRKFYLKVKLSYKQSEESDGYRMTLVIPITVTTNSEDTEGLLCQLTIDDVKKLYKEGVTDSYYGDITYKSVHRKTETYTKKKYGSTKTYTKIKESDDESAKVIHEDFKVTTKTTTVSWGVTSDADLKISKGWDAYDK
jgi:hypothetical protein